MLLLAHSAFSQDTLYVKQTTEMYELTPQMQEHIVREKNGIILVTNETFDSAFFDRITLYRKENNLPAFRRGNVRLDTLVVMQLYYMHLHDNPLHYKFIKEMQPHRDLLQCENLLYGQRVTDDETLRKPFFQSLALKSLNDIEGWFQRWRNSPGHNRNMLIDLPDASLRSMVRIVYKDGYIVKIIPYIAQEFDYEQSVREIVQHSKDTADAMVKERLNQFKNRQ